MWIERETLSPQAHYRWMTHLIVPRPIAWILTRNENGTLNLAPFSFFNAVTSKPPIVSVSIGRRPDGQKKDTLRNLERTGEAMIHLPSVAELDALNESARALPPEESEIDAQALPLVDESGLPLPRLESAQVAFFCRLYAVHEVGEARQGLVLCEVERLFLHPKLGLNHWDEHSQLPVERLDSLARLGGSDFARVGEAISRPRPD